MYTHTITHAHIYCTHIQVRNSAPEVVWNTSIYLFRRKNLPLVQKKSIAKILRNYFSTKTIYQWPRRIHCQNHQKLFFKEKQSTNGPEKSPLPRSSEIISPGKTIYQSPKKNQLPKSLEIISPRKTIYPWPKKINCQNPQKLFPHEKQSTNGPEESIAKIIRNYFSRKINLPMVQKRVHCQDPQKLFLQEKQSTNGPEKSIAKIIRNYFSTKNNLPMVHKKSSLPRSSEIISPGKTIYHCPEKMPRSSEVIRWIIIISNYMIYVYIYILICVILVCIIFFTQHNIIC